MIAFLAGLVIWAAAHLGILPFSAQVDNIIATAAAILGVLGFRDSIGDGSIIVTWLDALGTGWKTALGTVTAALAYLLSPDVLAVLPHGIARALTVVGAILAAFGIYHKAQIRAGRSLRYSLRGSGGR